MKAKKIKCRWAFSVIEINKQIGTLWVLARIEVALRPQAISWVVPSHSNPDTCLQSF